MVARRSPTPSRRCGWRSSQPTSLELADERGDPELCELIDSLHADLLELRGDEED